MKSLSEKSIGEDMKRGKSMENGRVSELSRAFRSVSGERIWEMLWTGALKKWFCCAVLRRIDSKN